MIRLLIVFTVGIALFSCERASADVLEFTYSGQVGDDPSAADGRGNNGWFLNGALLPAGTQINYQLTVDTATATDIDPTAGVGRFAPSILSVSIPSQGISSTANEPYRLTFENDNGAGNDEIAFEPADSTGGSAVLIFPGTANPVADFDTLSLLNDPLPGFSFLVGSAPSGAAAVTLLSGDVLSTSATEALANPTFSQRVVPEPQSCFLAATICLGGLARRKRANQ